jgi:nicotinamidase-related amidase
MLDNKNQPMLLELNYPEPVPVELDAAKTLLLIVDMENENCDPKGNQYIGEPVARIIPKIVDLRRRVREAGGFVIHTQSVRKPDALEFTLFKNIVRKVAGSWGAEFTDHLKPASDEPVVVKYSHDCFYETEMEDLLRRFGFRPGDSRVIVTGISTRHCVQCAVTGFSIRDYYVYVPMDCTTQRDEKDVLQAFSLFTGYGYCYNVAMTRSDLIGLIAKGRRSR